MGYINFDTTESYLEKKAKTFDKFQYEEAKSDDCLKEIKNINAQVENASNEVIEVLKKISDTYDEFTNFESSLSTCRSKLTDCIANAKKAIDEFQNIFDTQLKETVKKDKEFISDVEKESSNISKISDDTNSESNSNNSGGNTSPSPSPAPNPSPAPSPSPSPAPTEPNPSSTTFKHKDSNILADKAKAMGFTDEQIRIAVGISRWETGNYDHLAGGYNYGGVKGTGSAGKTSDGYAKYSSKDEGMNAFLSNLKRNYFDMGLNSPEAIADKYLGYHDNGSWTRGVKGCQS